MYNITTNTLGFTTSGTERMRISSVGLVGINQPSPATTLDIGGISSSRYYQLSPANLAYQYYGKNQSYDAATNPSYSFIASTTSGMFTPGLNAIAFSTNGTERMRMLAAGNIGINTTTPAYPLDVNGTANATNVRATTQHLGNTSDSATTPSYSFDNDTSVGMFNAGTNILGFTTSGTERMRILAAGNVGINQTSPSTTLDVGGIITTQYTSLGSNSSYQHYGKTTTYDNATNPSFSFNSNTNCGMFSNATNTLQFSTSSTEKMRISPVGNVGIGTTTPAYPLDVSGTANATNVRATTQHLGNIADSATTPSYSFDGDVNCGMYNISSNTIGFSTSSTERVRISAAGLIGINQTSPATTLDIGGTSSSQYYQLSPSNLAYQYYGKNQSYDAATNPSYSFIASTTSGMFTPALNAIAFSTNGTERMRMLAAGNIGIATTTPAYPLDVNGTANATNVRATTQHLGNTTDSATTPSYSFDGDVNCGMFNVTTNTLGFSTSSTERMRISSAGLVGINQASPSTTLDIGGTSSSQYYQLSPSNLAYQYYGKNQSYDAATNPSYSFIASTTSGMFTPTLNTVAFSTNGTERMRMLAAGNIGIATTTPAYPLDVSGTANATNVRATTQHLGNTTDSATTPSFSFDGDVNCGMFNATTNTIGFSTASTERMRISSVGNVGIGTTTPGYPLEVNGVTALSNRILMSADGSNNAFIGVKGGTESANLAYGIGISGTSVDHIKMLTNGSERLRITSAGNVGIGTTTPSYQLQLSSDSAAKPTSNTWTIASDQRIKYDIQPQDLQQSYSIISQLQLKQFKYDPQILPSTQNKTYVGFIAQEVEKIIPDSITTNNQYNISDFKSLDIDQINKHLIGAIQQLMNKVSSLEKEVSYLHLQLNNK
jgi:hypothetical protein